MGKRKTFRTKARVYKKAASKIKALPLHGVKLALVILVLGFLTSQLVLCNRLSTKGEELQLLEQQGNQLAQRKIDLDQEIAKLSSLSRIENESKEKLGMFSGIQKVEYFSKENVASLR